MIRLHRLRHGETQVVEGPGEVGRPSAGEHVWIEVEAPSPEEVRSLQCGLALHDLAVEDALRSGHPPKLEDFGDHIFFIVHSPEKDRRGVTRKLAVFLGKDWVVSVVRAPFPCIEMVRERVEREPDFYLEAPERIAHALLDHTVDAFEARVDQVIDESEILEERALEESDSAVLGDIMAKRRNVSSLLRTLRGQRDVAQALSRANHGVISAKLQPYLRDVYDHCLRVYELLEGAREGIAMSRDAFLSAQSNRMNQTMRVLTVIATVMMPLGVIAGIFGMNFDAIPGLHSPAGFWVTMAGMVVGALAMVVWFRRRDWV